MPPHRTQPQRTHTKTKQYCSNTGQRYAPIQESHILPSANLNGGYLITLCRRLSQFCGSVHRWCTVGTSVTQSALGFTASLCLFKTIHRHQRGTYTSSYISHHKEIFTGGFLLILSSKAIYLKPKPQESVQCEYNVHKITNQLTSLISGPSSSDRQQTLNLDTVRL